MGLSPIRAFLRRHRHIALDTSVFRYHIEANQSYVDIAAAIFLWLEQPSHSAVTSTITMSELLVKPCRSGDEILVNQYYGLFSQFPNLQWVAPNLAIAAAAAELRAVHGLRTPDVLQAATAVASGATAFLTNDKSLLRLPQIEVGILDRLRLTYPYVQD